MFGFVRQHAVFLFYSLVLHAGVVALLTFSFVRSASYPNAPPQIMVEATVVDAAAIEQALKEIEDAEQRETNAQLAREKKAREDADAERKRLADLRQKRKREQQQREADKKVAQQKAAAVKRLAAEQKAKVEAEQKRLDELAVERKAEEKRVARLKRQAKEAEDAREEARLQRELQETIDKENKYLLAWESGQLAQYQTMIKQKIERNWSKPPSARTGLECIVTVRQAPSGDVLDVNVDTCNGDAAVVRSIEAAVYKASPLPPPPDPDLFERNLRLTFRPES